MALIFPGSTCALCREPLDRPYTATSGVVFPAGSHLYRYCDAPLHFDCLERWPDREAFSAGYFDRALTHFRDRANLLVERANWILGCGPTRRNQLPDGMAQRLDNDLPYYAEVCLSDWPFRLYTYWSDWERFLAGGFREGLAGEALQVSERVVGEARRFAPNEEALSDLLEKSYR